jgi:hypothetical protein
LLEPPRLDAAELADDFLLEDLLLDDFLLEDLLLADFLLDDFLAEDFRLDDCLRPPCDFFAPPVRPAPDFLEPPLFFDAAIPTSFDKWKRARFARGARCKMRTENDVYMHKLAACRFVMTLASRTRSVHDGQASVSGGGVLVW